MFLIGISRMEMSMHIVVSYKNREQPFKIAQERDYLLL